MESDNSIIGNQLPTDIPETQVDETALDVEKKLARFSKTAEFKRLKDFVEAKIEFYQSQLPGGGFIFEKDVSTEKLGQSWLVAQVVITELRSIIDAYERAAEVVKNGNRLQ